MNQGLYAIYDVKAESPAGAVVQMLNSDAQAVRMFEQVIRTPGTLISDHPDDFVLVCVGRINYDTMVIEPVMAPLAVPVAYGHMIARAITRARDDAPLVEAQ